MDILLLINLLIFKTENGIAPNHNLLKVERVNEIQYVYRIVASSNARY